MVGGKLRSLGSNGRGSCEEGNDGVGGTEEMEGVGGVFGGGVYVCASHMHVLFEW